MTLTELKREVKRLERGGWDNIQTRVEITGREAGQSGRTRRNYAITATDPRTGARGGPWWEARGKGE